MIFDDAHHISRLHIQVYLLKAVFGGIIVAQAVERAYPKISTSIYQSTVNLVAGQRVRIVGLILIMLHLFLFRRIAPKTCTLRGEPQAMLAIFIDIDSETFGSTDTLEAVGLREIKMKALHRSHPCAPFAVVVDGIGTGIYQFV